MIEPFVVHHYVGDERVTLKGNGFDGLELGFDREEAELFIDFVNAMAVTEQRVKGLEQQIEGLEQQVLNFELDAQGKALDT